MSSNENFFSNTSKIKDSDVGSNVRVYDQAEVLKSELLNNITIGDSSNVVNSRLLGNNSINRRNYIFKSNIGKFTYTGIGTMIRSSQVGNFCSISWNVSIGGGDHPHDNVTTSTLNRFYMLDSGEWNEDSKKELKKVFKKQDPCVVGNDVLISSNVTILRDITIGNGAVIGAGSVVTKDVEPYSIVAGVPAKKIKMRFDQKTIEALQDIQWWNWPNDIIRENLELVYASKVDDSVLNRLREISKSIKQ